MTETTGKPKKSKKHIDCSTDQSSSEGLSSTSTPPPTINLSSQPSSQLSIGNSDSVESTKNRRTSKNNLTPTGFKVDEKPKDKSKDKDKRKLSKESSTASPSLPFPIESAIIYECEALKHAGRFKGWKKRTFKLRENGVLEYYVHGRMRGSFSVLSSVILLSKSDSCRFEIDTGQVVLHMRTTSAKDRDSWMDKIAHLQATIPKSSGKEESVVSQLEQKLQVLNKNIGLAKSLEAVLTSRMEIVRSESKTNLQTLVTMSADSPALNHAGEQQGAIVVDEGHHKKKRSHHRTKSEDMQFSSQFVSQASEIQRNITSLITSIESMSKEVSDLVISLKNEQAANMATPKTKTVSSSTSATDDPTHPEHLVIMYDDPSESDSEDYFDAGSDVASDEEGDSSSSGIFDVPNGEASSHGKGAKQIPISPERSSSSNHSEVGVSPSNVKRLTKPTSTRLSKRLETTHKGSVKEIIPASKGATVLDVLSSIPSDWKPRGALPVDKPKGGGLSLMKILKDAIGKDLTRITIPVQFSEPVNMLQRILEDFEYAELLQQAAEESDIQKRLLLVAAFASSAYASIEPRRSKPFNPILGETFEYIDKEKQFRFVGEQVSHHPPISAFNLESPNYVLWGNAMAKIKFWGKSLEINPLGSVRLRLTKFNEVYTWNKLTTCINNVLVGTKWTDNYGDLSVYNTTTGHKVLLDFKQRGWFDSNAHVIQGTAYGPDDQPTHRCEGLWHEYFAAHPINPDGSEGTPLQLWKRTPLPDHADKQYAFTSYCMRLNEFPEWMKPLLPRTDSRWRTDQRALENGDIDTAQDEKARLEEKQRAARKELAEAKKEHVPVWFEPDGEDWAYLGGYWEARMKGAWPDKVPDLY